MPTKLGYYESIRRAQDGGAHLCPLCCSHCDDVETSDGCCFCQELPVPDGGCPEQVAGDKDPVNP